MSQHNEVGKIGEDLAREYLEKKGYKILEHNYKTKYAEIDLIAERVLTLGAVPLHTFGDYIKNSKLTVGKDIHNDEQAITLILDSVSRLLKIERVILSQASEINDEGTISMMSDFIVEQEKTVWMLSAWLEQDI